jgi:hypothetical protein
MNKIKYLGDKIPEIEVLQIAAGQRIYIRHMVGETAKPLAEIEQVEGSALLTFHTDTVVVVEGLSQNGLTAKHLRFARKDRKKRGLHFAQVTMWPRLRRILKEKDRFNVPGGLEYIVAYPDEIVVADYSMSGSHGWLIHKEEIGGLLAENPLSKDQLKKLSDDLAKLEKEYEGFFTDEKIRESGNYLLNSFHENWWTQITIFWEDGSQKTFGFNGMEENKEGDLEYHSRGWSRYVSYKSIPVGVSDIVYNENYRWQSLFDHEPLSRQIAGFQRVKVEFMGGNDGMDIIHIEETSREKIIQYISSKDWVISNREKASRIKRTIEREEDRS